MTIQFHLNRAVLFLTALAISCSCVIQAHSQITVRASVDGQYAAGFAPPDAHAAIGPNHIVSWGNNSLMILNKTGTVISSQDASAFFGFSTGGDGHVIYDEISGRFAFEVLSTNASVGFAVSDTSDPTGPWHKINISVPGLWDGYGGNGIGYNADAYVVHVNGFNNNYAVIAASNNVNLAYTLITAPGGVRIGRPAPMTTATTGGPFYFVEGNDDGVNGQGGTVGTIEVLAISNILSGTPTYTDYEVPANNTGASVINVAWRNNLLAVTGFGPAGGVNWYLISTSNNATLLQSGTIVPVNNAGADVPSIAVAPNGSLGVNYTAGDSSNITTMYVTGRLATDAPGMMRPSQAIISGPTSDGRWGDYSSTVVDINSAGVPQNTFWACNEYLPMPGMFNWHTRVASFSLDTTTNFGFELPHLGPGSYQYNPSGEAWTFNGTSPSGSGIVANGSGFSNPNAPEGTQAAFVQSYGTITQTLPGFTPGTLYTITYSAAQRSGGSQHGGESWNVDIDNTPIKTNNPGSTSYTTYTATFTATAVTHNLSFVGTDLAGGDNTVFIDNVVISPALNPVSPSVAVTNPTNNTGYGAFAPVNLTASVTTNGNLINGVQFYVDNTMVGQIANAPYTCAWGNVSSRTHTVLARVLFNNGSSTDSTPVTFIILNANLNLGFESPSLGSGNYAYNPGGASWTLYSSGIAANGSAFGNPNAPEGVQAAYLQLYGTISQPLAGFAPGTNYTITYSAAQRGTVQNGGQTWNVVIDGTVIKTNSPGAVATSYTTYTANFTASAAVHTLAFVGTDLNGGDNTVFIDNVSINPPLATSQTPNLATNTLPVTAADVVGSQVTFLAASSSTNPITYQWQKIVGGLLSNIAGATNPVLTLTNLQLSDTASYRLQASNVFGIVVSTASPLTVSSVPAAVTNVIVVYAAQTGLGSVVTNFSTTWTVDPGSLIAGQTPSSVGSGSFSQNTTVLTDGTFGWLNYWPNVGSSPTEVTCGSSAGQSVTYTLGSAASGYSISNIVVYGGWGDAGRDQQAYTVYYSTVAAPTNFILLASVNYNPANPGAVQSATRATLSASPAGPLATNVAALKFDFTTPVPENGYCGYSEIAVYGTSINPAATMSTSPVTAADVVGSQVTFMAAFTGVGPLSYQWQKVSGGVTNNVAGETNTTLTLANLQLTNTASYQLQASNIYGVAVSTPSSLTVSSVSGAVNNVITSMAAQTGTGSGTFTPTWTITTNNSLIAGKSPSSTSGSFTLEVAGRSVNSLTDGGDGALTQINGTSGTTTSINYVTCGNSGGAGSLVTYTLTGFAAGYNLTNITVYGGWKDAGRDQQAYTVYYSKVTAPGTFISLGSVNYNPANPGGAQSATRATLTPANGVLATNVAAVKFDFTTPASENGYCGYREILLSGAPSPQPVKWAVGNGNWDSSTLNWKSLVTAGTASYLENNLAAFDDSATGSSPITVTLTGNHSPSVLTNNSTKNYVFAGNFAVAGGSLVKNGNSTLLLDNGGANGFTSVSINNGAVQVGNNDANGNLGVGNVTNNAVLMFNRTGMFTVSNAITGSGSVVQNGSGTLALSGVNTHAGSTTVNAGTLALVEPGSINASAQIILSNGAVLDVTGRADQTLTLNNGQTMKGSGSVQGKLTAQTGSTLNPGDTIGTLTVQSNVVLSGLVVMELNRTNGPASDELVSVGGTITAAGTLTVTNLGPPMQPGDTFQLFNWPVSGFITVSLPSIAPYVWTNNLSLNGTIQVMSPVATNPTNILVQLNGGNLTLAWPSDHIGWKLQAQTNGLAVGIGTNWADVSGSSVTNQMNIPISPANGGVFFRLISP
jgi:autotransporter-associated beta strand protein